MTYGRDGYGADANGVIDTGARAIIEECAEIRYFPSEIFDMLEPILQEALNSLEGEIIINVELINNTDNPDSTSGIESFSLSHIEIYKLRDIMRCARDEETVMPVPVETVTPNYNNREGQGQGVAVPESR